MPRFSAYFTDSSKTTLAVISQKSKVSNKKMKLVLGLSILKAQDIEEQANKLHALISLFDSDLNIGPYKPNSIKLEEKPVLIISTLLQRFTLSGRLNLDKQVELDGNAHLTKLKNQSSDEFRPVFEGYCDKFLKHILNNENIEHEAQKNTSNWLSKYEHEYLNGYKIINIDEYYKDPLYPIVFQYLKDLYITDLDFRFAVHEDAQRFVISENERFGNRIIEAIKARIWWHSTLHFLVENALFIMVAIREGMDAYCYDGKELNSFAALRADNRWKELIKVINSVPDVTRVDINSPSWLEVGYKTLSQKNVHQNNMPETKAKSLPPSPKKSSPISKDSFASVSNNNRSDRDRAQSEPEPHSFFGSNTKQDAGKRNKSWPPSSANSSDDEYEDLAETTISVDEEIRILASLAYAYKNDFNSLITFIKECPDGEVKALKATVLAFKDELDTLAKLSIKYNKEELLKVVAQVFKKDMNKVYKFVRELVKLKEQQAAELYSDDKVIALKTQSGSLRGYCNIL